jgi:outer membrane receptor protein involved in Fe transport
LYGQDAISAVINVVTIDPAGGGTVKLRDADDPLSFNVQDAPTSAGGTSFEVGGEAGVNIEREIWGWYGGVLDWCRDINVSGYVQYHDSELTPLDREFPAYWQDFRNIAITKTNGNGGGIVPSRKDYGLNLFGRAEWFDSSFQVWHRQSQRNSAEGYNQILGFLPAAKWGDSSTVLEGKNTLYVADNATLESALTYNGYEINPSSRYVFPDATDPVNLWFLDDFKYGRGWRLSLEETLRVELSEDFSLLTGVFIAYSDVVPKATIPGGFDPDQDLVTQGGSFFFSDVPLGPLQPIPRVSNVKFWTYAAYLEGQWQLLDDLRVVGGVRVTKDDHFDEIPVTPRAALIYNVTDRLTAKYMYSEAFVAPAPYFAFSTYDRGDILAQANPNVSPETAKTHEVNLTYDRENVSLGVAAYYGSQGNLIIVSDRNLPPNFVREPVFLDGTQSRRLVQTVNSGDSIRSGVDIYGKVTSGPFRSWISYSYTDYEETTAGMTTGLPGISRHNGRFGTTCWLSPKLFVTPSLVIRSTPENVLNPGRLADELHTPWEINLYVLYKRTEYMDFFLDLRNITDHHYALVSFTGDAFPQETFNGMAGVRLTY